MISGCCNDACVVPDHSGCAPLRLNTCIDPDEQLRFGLALDPIMENGETLIGVSWSAVGGDVLESVVAPGSACDVNYQQMAVVVASAQAAGIDLELTARISLTSPPLVTPIILDRTIVIPCSVAH